MGADIVLFPEMWSNGYRIYDRPLKEWTAEAISLEDDFVISFRKTCERAEYGDRYYLA